MAQVEVREITAVLPMHDTFELVQHTTGSYTDVQVNRYLKLSDRQYWDIMRYVQDRDAGRVAGVGAAIAHSDAAPKRGGIA